jgi:hypothetical protein
MAYLPYREDIETPEAGEQASINGIIQGMTQESETVEKRQGHAVRASHAKSTACVVGELIVPADLPPELAQGLFAKPGTYPVAVRFAQGPGENLGDRVSTHRGMSIKVFGVEGEKLDGHDAPTQDFVLASGTTFPASPAQEALADWRLDPHQDEDGFRHATVDFFAGNDVVFDLRAQLWTNAETQPIEDTSVDWPTADSPYRTIATLRLPSQAAYGDARVRYFDEVMTFRPAHSLAAHRPLGGVMRARLQVYKALSAFRHRQNGIDEQNTRSVDQIPA